VKNVFDSLEKLTEIFSFSLMSQIIICSILLEGTVCGESEEQAGLKAVRE
jgi:hypothetical protein